MTTNQPTIEERLSRLETLFVNVGEKVAEHDETIKQHDGNIDVLVANIQQLTENVAVVSQRVDSLAQQAAIDRQAFNERMDRLAAEAAQDRQQAAIDRQELRNSVNQILNYLRDRNGGTNPPQI
jgi:phage-related minor tail protein